jgi:hypothetical protein
MLTKPILALIIAACGVTSTPATAEPAEQPDKPLDLCAEVLYCSGNWAEHDGKVYCTSG